MTRLRIRHFVEKPGRGGTTRYYWQPPKALRDAGFRPERLPDDRAAAIGRAETLNGEVDAWRAKGGSLELKAYGSITPAPRALTIGALAQMYLASDKFARLAPSSRRLYRHFINRILDWMHEGATPVAAITKVDIHRHYERLARQTPASAAMTVRVLQAMFLWGGLNIDHFRKDNPAAKQQLVASTTAGIIWPEAAVTHFVATADAMDWHSIGTAVTLNEWFSQRPADFLAMPRRLDRGHEIVLTQSKTARQAPLPIGLVPHLRERLDAEYARQADRGATPTTMIACETTGSPWAIAHFRHVYAEIRAAAAVEMPTIVMDHAPDTPIPFTGLWFGHLRHTGVVRMAEAGATAEWISAITGHTLASVNTILEHYLVRTRKMARNAFLARLEASEN